MQKTMLKLLENHNYIFYCLQNVVFNETTWPSSGNTQYIQNTWEDITNVKYFKNKWDLNFM